VRLNVGCGGGKYAFYDLKCEVNCDVQKPKIKVSNFVLSDIRNLPFRDKVFQMVYAFNVLEHVSNPDGALRELNRIGSDVVIRFDKVYNLASWFTADHESIAIESTLRPIPRPIKWIVRLVRFPIDHSEAFQNMVPRTFPALRKLGLLDKWNYYEIK
jgi:SAM-dependent methyltransferase